MGISSTSHPLQWKINCEKEWLKWQEIRKRHGIMDPNYETQVKKRKKLIAELELELLVAGEENKS